MDTAMEMAMPGNMDPVELPEPQAGPSSSHHQAQRDLPPRSTSPPLPPRKDTSGLPPKYLSHLRRLLHQWLDQQIKDDDDDGLPSISTAECKLWTESQVKVIEEAIWSGAIVPQFSQTQGQGLLEIDWNAWILGANKRRKLWRKQQKDRPNDTADEGSTGKEGRAMTKKGSDSDAGSTTRGRKRLEATGGSPRKLMSRTPSESSAYRDTGGKKELSRKPDVDAGGNSTDTEEVKSRKWCETIRGLDGYQPLSEQPSPAVNSLSRVASRKDQFPGAFPNSGSSQHKVLPPHPGPPKTKYSLLKPVFCLSFVRLPDNHSSSTLQLQRNNSTSSMLRHGSVSSMNGGWWQGSGRSWRFGDKLENVGFEYIPGKFALPNATPPRSRRSSRSGSKGDVDSDAETQSMYTAESGSVPSDFGPGSSRTLSTRRSTDLVIGGGDLDVPDQNDYLSKVSLVGGTIVVRGINGRAEQEALAQIFRVLLYTTQVMFIELELMDAFRVARETDTAVRSYSERRQNAPAVTPIRRNRSMKAQGDKAKGFLNKLGRDTRGIFGGIINRTRNNSLSQDPPSHDLAEEPSLTPLSASLTHPLPSSSASSQIIGTPPVSQTTDRNLQILSHLETQALSTTPGLVIPMPSLLLRVRDEDRIRREKAEREIEDAPMERHFTLPSGSGTNTPIRDPVRGRAMGYRMGGDVRAGLASLNSGLDTFDGWKSLQRLDVLQCSNVTDEDQQPLCSRPLFKSMVFWDPVTDQSIEEMVSESSLSKWDCGSEECGRSHEVHSWWYLHGQRKVRVTLRRLEQSETSTDHDVWVSCAECHHSSKPRPLSQTAGTYSWGKLLELLLYGYQLGPADLCEHARTSFDSVRHYIRTPTHVITLSVEPLSVLDTRLPKLQVGPNIAKRKGGISNAAAAVESLTRNDLREKDQEVLAKDISDVFAVLEKRLQVLDKLIQAERSTPSADEFEDRQEKPQTGSDPLKEQEDALQALQFDVKAAATTLHDALEHTPVGQLNNIRQNFAKSVKETQRKITGWQKKYEVPEEFKDLPMDLPEYMSNQNVYAPPGSSLLIREDEPSSIFAYTLSSIAYFTELTSNVKAPKASDTGATDTPAEKPEFVDADGWTLEVKRRDTPRDLLSLRSLAKKRSEASMVKPDSKSPLVPPKANAPSLELSLEQVEGTMTKSSLLSRPRTPSTSESDTASTSTPRPSKMVRRTSDGPGPAAPPSAFRPMVQRSVSHTVPPSPQLTAASPALGSTPSPQPHTPETAASKDAWSSVTSSLTSSFNTLLRMGSDMGSVRMRGGDRALTSLIGPLSMMSAMDNSLSTSAHDGPPHISFTYTLPERIRIGCTIYYATAFDSLRRRCAIDKSMVTSLARCDIWNAKGGKSKASFFITKDKRYIVKELVSKWNVSDTQALLEIAPVYFEHLAGTHNKATALTKIVGFYTVKIHDLKTNTKKIMDLLVMENLFYKQTIAKRYDLKGMEGRKAPKGDDLSPIQFDSEWLEGQARAPILLYPHAKRILQEAISLDTKFLSREAIMDYSLLLGLDEEKKELVVGLVDAIGSYNLFKTIESRGKLALNRGGEVTVIPPDQYRERFETALKQYFLACPDKWSKSPKRHAPCTSLPPIL